MKYVLLTTIALCMHILLHASDQDATTQKRAEIAARIAQAKAARNKPVIKLATGIVIDESLEFALQAVEGRTFFDETWAELFSGKEYTFDQVVERHPDIADLLTMTDSSDLLNHLNPPRERSVDERVADLFNIELMLRYGLAAQTDFRVRNYLEFQQYHHFLALQHTLYIHPSLHQRIEELELYHYYAKYFSDMVSNVTTVKDFVKKVLHTEQILKETALGAAIGVSEKIFCELSRLKLKGAHIADTGNISLDDYKAAHSTFINALAELQDETQKRIIGKFLGGFRLNAASYFFAIGPNGERMSQRSQSQIVLFVLFALFDPKNGWQINLESLNEMQSMNLSCFFHMVIERRIGTLLLPSSNDTAKELEGIVSDDKAIFALWNQMISSSTNPSIESLKSHWLSIIALGDTLLNVCYEKKHGKKSLKLEGVDHDALVSAYQGYVKARTLLDQFRHIELEGDIFDDAIENVSNFVIELTAPECSIEKVRHNRQKLVDYMLFFEEERSLEERQKDRQCYKEAIEDGNAELISDLEKKAVAGAHGRIIRSFIEFSYHQEAAASLANVEQLHKEERATPESIVELMLFARTGNIAWKLLAPFCTAPYYEGIPYDELIAKASPSEAQLKSLYPHLANQIATSGSYQEIAIFNDKYLSKPYLTREQKLKLVLSYLKKALPVLEATDIPQVIERVSQWNQDLGGYKATELHSDVAGAVMTLMDLFIDECLWSSLDKPTAYANTEKSFAKLTVRLSPDQQEMMCKKKAELDINRLVVGYDKDKSSGKQKLDIIDRLTGVAQGKDAHAAFQAQIALEALIKEDGQAIATARQEREMEKQRKAKAVVVAKRELSPIGGKASSSRITSTEPATKPEKKTRSSTPIPHAIAHRSKGVPVKIQEPTISITQPVQNVAIKNTDTLEDFMREIVNESIVAARTVVKAKKAEERNKRKEALRIAKLAAKGKLGVGWIPSELKKVIQNDAAEVPDLDTATLAADAKENLTTYLECEKVQESKPFVKQLAVTAIIPRASYAQAVVSNPVTRASRLDFKQTEFDIEQIRNLDYQLALQRAHDGAFLNNRKLFTLAHYAQLAGGARSYAQTIFAELLSITTSAVPGMFCHLAQDKASEATAQHALNYLKSLDQDLLIPVCHDFLRSVFIGKQLHDQMPPDFMRQTYMNIAWYLRYCDDRIGAAVERVETINLLQQLQQPLESLAIDDEACRIRRYEQLVTGYAMMLHTTVVNGNVFCYQRICELLARENMVNSCPIIEEVLVPAQRSFLERRLQDLNRIIGDGADETLAMERLVGMLEQAPKITAEALKHKVRFVL